MSEEYWENRYLNQETPWDIGYASPSLVAFFETLENKDLKILIPGGGSSYEAEWLWKNDFKNVWVIDISATALSNFKNRFPEFPESQLLEEDFFKLKDQFDLIVEQTFFCALNPELRKDYVKAMHQLLAPEAKLIGLLFNFPLSSSGPPYGGSQEEYETLFNSLFKIHRLEPCYNSIKSRSGKEFFFHFIAC